MVSRGIFFRGSHSFPELKLDAKTLLNTWNNLKINDWNIIPWRFGSDHVPFFSWVICRFQALIFQGFSYLDCDLNIC